MKQSGLRKVSLLLGVTLVLCGLAAAQDNSSNSTESKSTEKKNPRAKPKKTWTDDDVTALRSPADAYSDQERGQAEKSAPAANTPAAAQSLAASKEPRLDKPPLLSNPKTVESADKMIAWEERDIAAQEEFVARLKTQLETTPFDEQDALQKKIADREKIVADTRKERDGLAAQKKELVKKAAGAAVQPPQ
jgi:flagellum-specific peptidoglycan hydrolase FlgJ